MKPNKREIKDKGNPPRKYACPKCNKITMIVTRGRFKCMDCGHTP